MVGTKVAEFGLEVFTLATKKRAVTLPEYGEWIAVTGPDTSPLRERVNASPVTMSQIASTIAALLGEVVYDNDG